MLKSKDGATLLTTSASSTGSFTFATVPAGIYTLLAEAGDQSGNAAPVTVSTPSPKPIELLLDNSRHDTHTSAPGAARTAEQMEFSDKPSFAVAGVTDWTAAGGHGSDVNLRTSEDLTRETLQLKSPDASKAAATDQAGQEASLVAAVAATPGSYAANRDLGLFYLHAAHYSEALKFLQAASAINHDAAVDAYHLALACQGLGDLPHAREHVQHALSLQDDAQYHRLSGELSEQLGDPLAAVQQEEQAARMAPTEENYFIWGSELLLHRAIHEATAIFAEGARLHPGSARLQTAWGGALFAGAAYEEAATRLCVASDLAPNEIEPYLFMGRIVVASPSALPCVQSKLERFLQLHPQDARAAYYYAMSLLKQGTPSAPQQAEVLLKKAASLDPKYAEVYLQLGILAFSQRDSSSAIRFYNQAIAADPQQAEAHYRLAVAYDRVGDLQRAKQQFRLHESIQNAQADAVEQQRRQVKQFLIVLKTLPPASGKP